MTMINRWPTTPIQKPVSDTSSEGSANEDLAADHEAPIDDEDGREPWSRHVTWGKGSHPQPNKSQSADPRSRATVPLPVKMETDTTNKKSLDMKKNRTFERQNGSWNWIAHRMKSNGLRTRKNCVEKGTAPEKALQSTPKSTLPCQPAISKPTCHPSSISEIAKPPLTEIMSRIQDHTEHLDVPYLGSKTTDVEPSMKNVPNFFHRMAKPQLPQFNGEKDK
jgi:hypothetical protein